MIPVSPVRRENADLRTEIEQAVSDVIASGELVLGPNVQQFEDDWAHWVGSSHAAGLASGMDALEAALRIVGVQKGDHVLVPALSAAASALAPVRIGAIPIFVDVDPETAHMDVGALLNSLNSVPSAILYVGLYGLHPCKSELDRLKGELKVPVVLDMAQAHPACGESNQEGLNVFPAAWSFYPTKNLGALGDGGALTTEDSSAAIWVKQWRNYGQEERYRHVQLGVNSRLDEIQAAVLRVKLMHLYEWTMQRRRNAIHFIESIDEERLQCLVRRDDIPRHSLHQFVVLPTRRNEFREFMAERGVQTDIHYPAALRDQDFLSQYPGERLETAVFMAERLVSIPVHPYLSDSEVERIAMALKQWCMR